MAAKFKEADCNACYGNKPEADYPLNLWLPQPPLKMAVMMKWLSFITFFSLNPPQFIRGGLPRHNNAKTHFHGSPHGMMSMKGQTTDFLCKGSFWKREGARERQLILLLQMTSVFCLGGLRVVKPAWLLLMHFNSDDAGAWLIAGVLLASLTSVCISSSTHRETCTQMLGFLYRHQPGTERMDQQVLHLHFAIQTLLYVWEKLKGPIQKS